jgi:hypothetical protein
MSKEKTHWMQSPNKNYLGHWDLPESGELTVTIKSAKWEAVKNPITNTTESKRVIHFKDKGVKPMICNQTNAQAILRSSGVKFMEDSEGVVVCLYVDSIKDKRTKEDVDCIRVKPVNPYTLENLTNLFNSKKEKLNDAMNTRISEIMTNEETPSYIKAIQHLQSL